MKSVKSKREFKESGFVRNGRKFVVAVATNGCEGCALFDDFDLCHSAPSCMADGRFDAKSVIFVEAKKEGQK